MEVKDILSAAMKAVDEAKIKEDFREIAFGKAVDLLAASSGMPTGKETPPSHAKPDPGADDGTLLGRLSGKTKVDLEVLKQVYHEADGKFDIIVPTPMFERAKSTGMKQIALLVAVARQGSGIEEFTDADHVRHFADTFNKYDSANFATDLKNMDDEFRIRREGRKILLKLTRPGLDRAVELIRWFAGETES